MGYAIACPSQCINNLPRWRSTRLAASTAVANLFGIDERVVSELEAARPAAGYLRRNGPAVEEARDQCPARHVAAAHAVAQKGQTPAPAEAQRQRQGAAPMTAAGKEFYAPRAGVDCLPPRRPQRQLAATNGRAMRRLGLREACWRTSIDMPAPGTWRPTWSTTSSAASTAIPSLRRAPWQQATAVTRNLSNLEAAITGARPAPAKVEAQELANDLLRIAEAQAECKLSAARYVLEHAQYLHDLCTADAKQSLAKEREFVGHVLAAEERKMAELRRILGKITG